MSSINISKIDSVFMSNTRKRVGKAIHKYELIKENDSVLIAVSGGKDSLFLLESLAMQRINIPFKYELKAIHIEVNDKPYEIDKSFLEELCNKYDIPLYYKSIEVGDLLESKKGPCFTCSWNRRKALFNAVKEYGCNKLALGHHMDDAIETLLLNMTHHGSISSIPPELEMFKGEFEIIRPLILLEEDKILKYSQLSSYPQELKLCPFENKGNRYKIKSIMSSLKKINKNAGVNLFRSMSKIDYEYLPQNN